MNVISKSNSLFLFMTPLLLLVISCSNIINNLGGGYSDGNPDAMMQNLSNEAQELIEEAYKPFKENQKIIVDHHVHIVGSGNKSFNICSEINKTGIYLNQDRFSLLDPLSLGKTKVLMNSSKITNLKKSDEQYAERLLSLARNAPYKTNYYLLALDGYWEKTKDEDGSEKAIFNKDKTDLYVPNDYVVKLTKCLNNKLKSNRFIPVISVHPYRPNAIDILEEFNKQNVQYVKWLPNVMNIDPRINDEKYKSFYKKMNELGMVLMSHTGWEEATEVTDKKYQELGFPAFLENALDAGVTVIMSHSGGDEKLEVGVKTSHESFLEMMAKANEKPGWTLYGDISALTLKKNIKHFKNIIDNEKLKGKILYGSDYPLPATYFLYPVDKLIEEGYLKSHLGKPLKEIFKYNPLVFDFVLKRNIQHPITGKKLPPEVFLSTEDNK
jgi:predicted TIM-barrel fold metal-dependent hydrolase